MTDNDVIKALEYCCDAGVDHCKGCPCFEHTEGCVGEREALDVIYHLQEEIKQKDTEIDILIRKKETLKDEIAEKQAEIEELQKYKHDYYVLQSITRKEFAERFKKVFWSRAECDILIRKAIDNLLEEMESERE